MERSGKHLRQDLVTEKWVIYSPQRSQRPQGVKKAESEKSQALPEKDSSCPFCPGNETQLPDIITSTTNALFVKSSILKELTAAEVSMKTDHSSSTYGFRTFMARIQHESSGHRFYQK